MSADIATPRQGDSISQGLHATTTYGWALEPAKARGLSAASARFGLEPSLPSRTLSAAETRPEYTWIYYRQPAVNPKVTLARFGKLQLEGG